MRKKRGSTVISVPIVMVISFFLICVLVVTCINSITPFMWYEKLSMTTLRYMFIMEEYGYLTAKERNNLLVDLENEGFDTGKVTITATGEAKDYGEPISLKISYKYISQIPKLITNRLAAEYEDNEIEMNILKQSVSKR